MDLPYFPPIFYHTVSYPVGEPFPCPCQPLLGLPMGLHYSWLQSVTSLFVLLPDCIIVHRWPEHWAPHA